MAPPQRFRQHFFRERQAVFKQSWRMLDGNNNPLRAVHKFYILNFGGGLMLSAGGIPRMSIPSSILLVLLLLQ